MLVAIHDVYLPDDYSPRFAALYWSEQYMLATHLLALGADAEIVLPAWYVSHAPQYRDSLQRLWDGLELADAERHGNLFWFVST